MTKKIEKPSYVLRDIPLDQESGRRHIPVLMGLLVFLLIIVFTAAITIGSALHKWQNPGGQKVTIEILEGNTVAALTQTGASTTPISAEQAALTPNNTPIDIEKIKNTLRTIPGVSSFEILDHEKLMLLLQPWVGDTGNLTDLKMPLLIDVELDTAYVL